jgi:glycine/D-amino acid oxidase-like deaminating enzyme
MRSDTLASLLGTPSVWQLSQACQPRWLQALPFSSDLVVIGAGLGGLSAALHALHAGYSVTVLEAGIIGAGASGRNSGFVVPVPSRHNPASLQHVLGDSTGHFLRGLQRTARVCLGAEGTNVTRHGWAQPFPDADRAGIQSLAQQWRAYGCEVEHVEQDRLSGLIGTSLYGQGLLFKDGGAIDPYALLQQMAAAITLKGGVIVERCLALRTAVHGAGVCVHTGQGCVAAQRVLLAGNAYGMEASRATQQSVGKVALALATFSTAALPSDTENLPFSDTRKDMWFCRRLHNNALMTGAFVLPGTNNIAESLLLMRQRLACLYGDCAPAPEQIWAGLVGVTRAGIPVVRSTSPGVIHWGGCNGRGLALSVLMGECLVDRLFDKTSLCLPSAPLSLPVFIRWLALSLVALDRTRQARKLCLPLSPYPVEKTL